VAHFYGTVHGNRGEVSRLGSAQSGIAVRANGWNTGVRVSGMVEDDKDVFYIFANGGSNGNGGETHVATIRDGIITHWNVEPKRVEFAQEPG
jgi:hypothetical protein